MSVVLILLYRVTKSTASNIQTDKELEAKFPQGLIYESNDMKKAAKVN